MLAEHAPDAHDAPDATVVSVGPALIFERLWRETGCQAVVRTLLATRHHHFDVERAVFMTVLHRLFVSGSDRSALQWRRDQAIDGVAALELQHLYRAMGWLGEALGAPEPDAPSPRRTKDLIEEALFARRRDLFTDLDLVFFDTTSVFFTGDGGERLGQYGKSKDRRSDCKQMALGMVIDGDGVPVCSEMWPGNTTDVTTLDRVAGRLQRRFAVRRVCLVADAAMMSKKMVAAVEARGWLYILGARLRRTKEVREVVLTDTAPFESVEVERQRPDPMELQVKEVTVCDTPGNGAGNEPPKPRRYVVCRNPDQARKDAMPRFETVLIACALGRTGGRRQEAARLPGRGRNTLTRKIQGAGARRPRACIPAQSAPAGTGTALRLPGNRAPAMPATMAAVPSQTNSRSKLPLASKTQPASTTVRPATPSASTNFAP